MAASSPKAIQWSTPLIQRSRETREPPEDRHEELEEAEVPRQAHRGSSVDPARAQADADGDGEGIHGQAHGDAEKGQQVHAPILASGGCVSPRVIHSENSTAPPTATTMTVS